MNTSTPFDLGAYLDLDANALWDEPFCEQEEDVRDESDLAASVAVASHTAADASGAPLRTVPEPDETIEGLVKALPQYRRLFLEVVRQCEEPQAEEDLCSFIAEAQRTSRSVYAPETLCEMLERAGALARVDVEGAPLAEAEPVPMVVEEDGVEYLTCAEPAPWRWAATEPGRAWAAADDPLGRLGALFDEERAFAPVYRHILEACATEAGAVMADLNASVNALSEVRAQKRRAGYFVDRLERCDAIAWDKVWRTTPVGAAGLESLQI